MLERIAQIMLAAIITERLIDGLHKFYWTAELKRYLVGDNDGLGILNGWKREYVRCKFCQSWWVAWGVSLIVLILWEGWSWHWVWMGVVTGWLSNMLHNITVGLKYKGMHG